VGYIEILTPRVGCSSFAPAELGLLILLTVKWKAEGNALIMDIAAARKFSPITAVPKLSTTIIRKYTYQMLLPKGNSMWAAFMFSDLAQQTVT
jgi:hypothetical protein